ncbi:hypothetical protein ACI2KR_06910 [Pseudomonas luteola]
MITEITSNGFADAVLEALEGYTAKSNIGELYDEDDELASAMNRIPGFEYPDYSHFTVEGMKSKIKKMAELH